MGQLFAAACGDVGGIRNGPQVGVGGDAKLCKAGRQTDPLDERRQRVDTGNSSLLVAILGRKGSLRFVPVRRITGRKMCT